MVYKILHLDENVNVELIDCIIGIKCINSLCKISRTSISEGIFESQLAEVAKCEMVDGNLYKITNSDDPSVMYVHCDGEYAYIGGSLIELSNKLDHNIER